MEKMLEIVVTAFAEAVRDETVWFKIWNEDEENTLNHNIWMQKAAESNAYRLLLSQYGFTNEQILKMECEALK